MMILGFIFSYVSGFLMTAVPRMTGTQSASLIEKSIASGLVLLFLMCSFLGHDGFSFLVSTGMFTFLISFFVRRKLKMKNRELPTGFIFIPLGLMSGLIGSVLVLSSSFGFISLLALGKLFLYEGFILNLIIGLGSRLIPVLTRKSMALSPAEVNELSHRLFFTEAVVFNGSFLIEVFLSSELGILIRALTMSLVLVKNFRFLKPMSEKSNLGLSISTVAFMFPLSYFLIIFFPTYKMHLIHVLYIMGIASLTFLVSVRVSLAHGGANLELEKSANAILAFFFAFLTATFFRAIGPLFSGEFILHFYALAATFFLLGLFIWGWFLRTVLFVGDCDSEKC
jgi:uncharacterized protein involved in response to NO